MRSKGQKYGALMAVAAIMVVLSISFLAGQSSSRAAFAQAVVIPTPAATPFDRTAALVKLREQTKGKEREPAETVFKNIQMPMFKGAPASRVLAVMEFGYARSLGVNCTHCHAPDAWESEAKPQKQIARDMQAMVFKISGEMLRGIKNLGDSPTVNCTTCHRGQIKPATNLP
ncbi:MAG: photosynthetic reaction center cytochrome c subunit family protein [Pyrinomonadaceae bacterium]